MDVDSPNALKRCSSAPQINNLLATSTVGVQPMEEGQSQPAASSLQHHQASGATETHAVGMLNAAITYQVSPQTGSRESLPTSFSNIFTPRVRRFSASFNPLAVISNGSASPGRSGTSGRRLTPRISQLRQEECADVSNSREVNHEREVHSAMQMSQSYEDLTLVAENWSFTATGSSVKMTEELQNPLHVALPTLGSTCCSSPSPTSRGGITLQYPTTSPSPTRKFVTRRSMSPCPLRPSPLSTVKRKINDQEDHYGNCYSPPPKKIFTSERGSSPVCQTPSPSPICPSPDSSTTSFENGSNNVIAHPSGTFPLVSTSSGRVTPKFFLSKLSGVPGPGATPCLALPFGIPSGPAMHFGVGGSSGGSSSSSQCTTPTGINPAGMGVPIMCSNVDLPSSSSVSSEQTGPPNAATLMMDCGVSSSSSSSSSECRDTMMEVSHSDIGEALAAKVPTEQGKKVDGETKLKESVDGSELAAAMCLTVSNRGEGNRRALSAVVGNGRELREQLLKTALDQEAGTLGSCNSNSSNSSINSIASSQGGCGINDSSNYSANSSLSRVGRIIADGSSVSNATGTGAAIDSSSSSNSSSSSSSCVSESSSIAAAAATSAVATICPQLSSFPRMGSLTEIAES
ncbi:serine-rich adhesin for platelets [Anopheles cruzii]|uniref:serine-rich adhesin for platelets n=1 Tax=Anopheles cruzii TaxID=68878 RepID=UPI0022EC94BF|nr:serine-rich adhesin for platelets [Anopheles cruzii]